MKLVKMSLAAAVLLGASAFAVDNIKVSGDAKVYYNTNNADYTGTDGNTHSGMFDKEASAADTALRIGVTGDLLKGVSFGATGYAVSTLGLENNLVNNTWTGAHGAPVANGSSFGAAVDDKSWMSEMWIAATLGKTTAKVGRMELDTPLAFSESWSVAKNTFDAAVLINQDLPDTTLVGAWVGKGNGVNALGAAEVYLEGVFSLAPGDLEGAAGGYNNLAAVGIDGIMGSGAKFGTFMNKGAYAVAAVNNSFKPLTAQAWYYNVGNVADAYWLQADINCQMVKGLSIGGQYANMDPKGKLDAALNTLSLSQKDSDAYAVKLAYEGVENLKVSAAYSETDKDGVLKIANVATNNLGTAQSKLYTEAWWNYGYVGAAGAESYNLTAEYNAGVAKVGVYFTDVDVKPTGATETTDMTEVAVTVSKSFGALDATLAYISTDADDQNEDINNQGQRYDTIQAYLTLNF